MINLDLHYNILDDLSEDLLLTDLYHFMSINDLTYELKYNIHRRVEYYYIVFNPKDYHNVANYACIMMDVRSIIWLRNKKGVKNTYRAMMDACCLGRLKMVKWLHYKSLEDYELSEDTLKHEEAFDIACRWGHIEVVKWLHKHNYRMNRMDILKLVDSTMRGKTNSEVVRFLCENEPEWIICKVNHYTEYGFSPSFRERLTHYLKEICGFVVPDYVEKIDE